MLDHFGLYCRDADVSLPFYRACLAPLGIVVVQEQPHFRAAIFKREGSPIFWWLGEGGPDWREQAGRSRIHLGFTAASPAEVDGFYQAALAAGGQDNGPPGYRRPTCYSAFVIDPTATMPRRSGRPNVRPSRSRGSSDPGHRPARQLQLHLTPAAGSVGGSADGNRFGRRTSGSPHHRRLGQTESAGRGGAQHLKRRLRRRGGGEAAGRVRPGGDSPPLWSLW